MKLFVDNKHISNKPDQLPVAKIHSAGSACVHCAGHVRKFSPGHVNIPDAFGYKQASKLGSGNSI